jgi:hypothetical protein
MRLRSIVWLSFVVACSASGKGIFPVDGGGTAADGSAKNPDETKDGGGSIFGDSGKKGDGTATVSGEVTLKNVSFSGSADTGSFTFIVTNESSKSLETVSEVRIRFPEGELVFATGCTKLLAGDALALAPGATSDVITMNVSSLYYSSGYVTIECGGVNRSPSKTSGPSLSSSSSMPEALTLKGIYDDAAKWTATADVE